MNFMKQNFEHIDTRGINLNHIGINAYAYDYLVIPDLLDNLKANNQIILGGDVFCYKNGQLKHTYDNWYYEGNIQSDSIIKTRKYLDNFKNNQNLYVSFVFK